MDCSTEKSIFADDFYGPWIYNFDNGTTLYCNGSYTMNWVCNSTIEPDADIAGPGVITSFILVAWITMCVAMIPAFYDVVKFMDRTKDWNWRFSTVVHEKLRSTKDLRRTAQLRRILDMEKCTLLRKTASSLLGSLCDLQIVTGLAIVIAGLAQIPTISFYHESLAMQYWWLTLNSFWAARVEYMDENSLKYTGRATIRRIGVFISVVLGSTFQCIINVREDRDWFFLRSGYCYISHDDSSTWPWIAGTSIYAVSLLLTIIPATRPWVHEYLLIVHQTQGRLVERWKKSANALHTNYLSLSSGCRLSPMRTLLRITFRMAVFGFSSLCLAIYWLLLQFLAAWSYGDGFYPLLFLVYVGFAAWTTFDILDLKLSNRALLNGQELSWGFGQVLSMVLLIMIGYNAADAFIG